MTVALPPCPTLRANVAPIATHDCQMLKAAAMIATGLNVFAGASISKQIFSASSDFGNHNTRA